MMWSFDDASQILHVMVLKKSLTLLFVLHILEKALPFMSS